jgi:hypothetical protein
LPRAFAVLQAAIKQVPAVKYALEVSGLAAAIAMTKETLPGAFAVLQAAIKQVPAVKYALGVSGLAVAIAIIGVFISDWRVAVFGIIVMLILIVAPLVFAKLTSVSGKDFRTAALTFMRSSLALIVASGTFLFISVFFDWPINHRRLNTIPKGRQTAVSGALEIDDIKTVPNAADGTCLIDFNFMNKSESLILINKINFYVTSVDYVYSGINHNSGNIYGLDISSLNNINHNSGNIYGLYISSLNNIGDSKRFDLPLKVRPGVAARIRVTLIARELGMDVQRSYTLNSAFAYPKRCLN